MAVSGAATVTDEGVAYGQIAYVPATPTVEERQVAVHDTEAVVRAYFKDIPIMIQVARCESTFRHTLADGSVLQGKVDPADTGVMQINRRFHQAEANKLGLDLNNIYDNMAYARHLYEKQGVQPWSASSSCWGHTLAYNN